MPFYFIRWNALGKDQFSNNKRPQSAVFHGSKKWRKKSILKLYLWFVNSFPGFLWQSGICRPRRVLASHRTSAPRTRRAGRTPALGWKTGPEVAEVEGLRLQGALGSCWVRQNRGGRLVQPGPPGPWTLLRKGSPTQWFQLWNPSLRPSPWWPVFTPTSSSRGQGLWFLQPDTAGTVCRLQADLRGGGERVTGDKSEPCLPALFLSSSAPWTCL